ncbi:MAG: hypothetical protein JWO94_2421 [Verrucomicrobiaceae bacterium]|nr:hypothetical protein [Verrucomicrobiaceae bacterium]
MPACLASRFTFIQNHTAFRPRIDNGKRGLIAHDEVWTTGPTESGIGSPNVNFIHPLPAMKMNHPGMYALIGLAAFQLTLQAQDNNHAASGTSGPVRPLKSNDAVDPGILAGERKAQFDRLDADKNGRLSPEEFARISALARRIGSGIGTAGVNTPETDGNPMIPTGDLSQLFKQLDADKDGLLTLKEFVRVPLSKSDDSSKPLQTDAANISRSTGATVGRPSLGNLDRSALFHRLDKNGDGNLDAEEFSKMTATELPSGDHAAAFHRLDSDSNGKISKEEFSKLIPDLSTQPGVPR